MHICICGRQTDAPIGTKIICVCGRNGIVTNEPNPQLGIYQCTRCSKFGLYWANTMYVCSCGQTMYAVNPLQPCSLLENNVCKLVSVVAGRDIKTTPEVCVGCLNCNRPRMLNEFNLCTVPPEATEDAVKAMHSLHKGTGTDLSIVFGMFAKADASCGCNGLRDILDTWDSQKIAANIDRVVDLIHAEARRRNIYAPHTTIKAAVKLVAWKNG